MMPFTHSLLGFPSPAPLIAPAVTPPFPHDAMWSHDSLFFLKSSLLRISLRCCACIFPSHEASVWRVYHEGRNATGFRVACPRPANRDCCRVASAETLELCGSYYILHVFVLQSHNKVNYKD